LKALYIIPKPYNFSFGEGWFKFRTFASDWGCEEGYYQDQTISSSSATIRAYHQGGMGSRTGSGTLGKQDLESWTLFSFVDREGIHQSTLFLTISNIVTKLPASAANPNRTAEISLSVPQWQEMMESWLPKFYNASQSQEARSRVHLKHTQSSFQVLLLAIPMPVCMAKGGWCVDVIYPSTCVEKYASISSKAQHRQNVFLTSDSIFLLTTLIGGLVSCQPNISGSTSYPMSISCTGEPCTTFTAEYQDGNVFRRDEGTYFRFWISNTTGTGITGLSRRVERSLDSHST
jgi:hypothetical protein